MSEVGIRPGAETPVETQVKTTTARQLDKRCHHGRVVWLIGSQRYHRKSEVAGEENLLESCAAQLRLEERG